MKNEEDLKKMTNIELTEVDFVRDTLECMLLGMVQKHGLELTAVATLFGFSDTLSGYVQQKKWNKVEEILTNLQKILKDLKIDCEFELHCCPSKTIEIERR